VAEVLSKTGKGIEGQIGCSTEGGMVKLKLETCHAISGFP
jgi:hypothetical protein